jgi:hypothetical protein
MSLTLAAMTRRAQRRILVSFVAVLGLAGCLASGSQLLFESTQMGAPGAPGGLSVSSSQFLGARFHLSSGAVIDGMGGHLFAGSGGNGLIFGALVRLTSLTDVPDSADLSTPDVLALTTFQLPAGPSADTFTSIAPIGVPAGDYAIVFGSGLFGATGSAGAPDDNVPSEINAERSLAYHGGSGFGWDVAGNSGLRFTAYGTIPEPNGVLLFPVFGALWLRYRRAPRGC